MLRIWPLILGGLLLLAAPIVFLVFYVMEDSCDLQETNGYSIWISRSLNMPYPLAAVSYEQSPNDVYIEDLSIEPRADLASFEMLEVPSVFNAKNAVELTLGDCETELFLVIEDQNGGDFRMKETAFIDYSNGHKPELTEFFKRYIEPNYEPGIESQYAYFVSFYPPKNPDGSSVTPPYDAMHLTNKLAEIKLNFEHLDFTFSPKTTRPETLEAIMLLSLDEATYLSLHKEFYGIRKFSPLAN